MTPDMIRNRPRAWCRWLTAPLVAAALLIAPTAADASLQTLIAFDPVKGQTPENLAIDRDGTIYVSLAFASEIVRIALDGSRTTLALPTAGGITVW